MADAVLENYNLGPALNAGTFVEAMNNSANIQQRGLELDERKKERQDALNERTSEYLSKLYDANKYKGTLHDDDYAKEMGDILTDAQGLALQGKSLAEIQAGQIGKRVTDFVTRFNQEKQVKSDIDASLAKFKGVKGFNQERLAARTYQLALYNQDPGKPGVNGTPFKNPNQDPGFSMDAGGLKYNNTDPGMSVGSGTPYKNTDPGMAIGPTSPAQPPSDNWTRKPPSQLESKTDWAQEAINRFPRDIMNQEGMDAAMEGFLKREGTDVDKAGTITLNGREYDTGYKGRLSPWERLSNETDEYGNPKGVIVGGIPIHEDPVTREPIKDENGKEMMVVPDKVYNNWIGEQGVLPALRGMAQSAFEQTGQPLPPKNSYLWELWQKHELYNYLDANKSGHYHPITKETEESKKLRFEADPRHLASQRAGAYNLSYLHRLGTIDADIDNGINPGGDKTPKEATSVASAVASVYQGKFTGPPIDYDGKKYEDIHSVFPGGDLKYGKSAKETYDKVMLDPRTMQIVTVRKDIHNKDVVERSDESQAEKFIGFHAEANGKGGIIVNKRDFKASGYSNGTYSNHRTDNGAALDQLTKEENDKKIDIAIKGENYKHLKGIDTPAGKVKEVSPRGGTRQFFGADAFSVEITPPGSKETITKTFKTKEALADYLKGGSAAAPAASAKPAAPAASGTPAAPAAPVVKKKIKGF